MMMMMMMMMMILSTENNTAKEKKKKRRKRSSYFLTNTHTHTHSLSLSLSLFPSENSLPRVTTVLRAVFARMRTALYIISEEIFSLKERKETKNLT